MWAIDIPGEPKGKGRPRFSRASGHPYTPKQTEIYENLVKLTFKQEYPDHRPVDTPLSVSITAVFQIPQSWSKRRRAEAIRTPCRKKPDIDNILKAILDGLNGVAYLDDSQIVEVSVSKMYGERPHVIVYLEELIE